MKGARTQRNRIAHFCWRKEIKCGTGDTADSKKETHEILLVASRIRYGRENGGDEGHNNERRAERAHHHYADAKL